MSSALYKAVFFDLDGTLLPMDLNEFLTSYMTSITRFAAGKGLEPAQFSEGLNQGIRAMAKDDGERSNEEIFWEYFFKEVPEASEDVAEMLIQFYENEFGVIGKNVVPNPYARKSLEVLQQKGYPLALTTMPMFPLRAVEWRCEWAGVEAQSFERITTFENSTSVKPKLAYFEENLKAAGLKPQEVLMVGNNTREDLVCLELGMDAFLITDHLINPNEFDINTVKHGSFEEFFSWVEYLEACSGPAVSFETGIVRG